MPPLITESPPAPAAAPAAFTTPPPRRMGHAAAELKFESAARIKAYLDQVSQFAKGPFRHARRLPDFQFVSLQGGPRDGTAKLFLITPGEIQELVGLITEPTKATDLLRLILDAAWSSRTRVDATGAERIGIVAHHLFLAKQASGIFLRVDSLDDKSLSKAFRDVQKQKPKDDAEEEGLL